MKAPLLEENKCSILFSEYATGHVFKKNLTVFLKGDNEEDVFQVFDDKRIAVEFALDFVKNNPEFECTIYDHIGQHIVTFDQNGERK